MLYLYYLRKEKKPKNYINPIHCDFKTKSTFYWLQMQACKLCYCITPYYRKCGCGVPHSSHYFRQAFRVGRQYIYYRWLNHPGISWWVLVVVYSSKRVHSSWSESE
jgi:hypothetical protein